MLRPIWQRFWEWFTEPMPFPRDHWYRPNVVILWDEFDCEVEPATPVSQAGELAESHSPGSF